MRTARTSGRFNHQLRRIDSQQHPRLTAFQIKTVLHAAAESAVVDALSRLFPVLGHPLTLVIPALVAHTPPHVRGSSAVLEIVPASSAKVLDRVPSQI